MYRVKAKPVRAKHGRVFLLLRPKYYMTTSYALPEDFLRRYDARILGDLVNDNNISVDATSLLTNLNLQAALDDASGQVNSAVLVANKYSPAELQALDGIDREYLVRLVCNLAYGLLVMRRGLPSDKLPQYDEALETLKLLRSGERVFAVLANQDAGNPQASFPSFTVYSNLQLMRDVSKYFPVRRDQRVT